MKSLRWKLEIYLSRFFPRLSPPRDQLFPPCRRHHRCSQAEPIYNVLIWLLAVDNASKKRPVRKSCVLHVEKLLILIINYEHQTGREEYCINHPRVASHCLIQHCFIRDHWTELESVPNSARKKRKAVTPVRGCEETDLIQLCCVTQSMSRCYYDAD